ncbi:MAG TPA: hypothetical protein VFG86_16195, partial [Chloroflexota bacterium]|nr:hypothetical protein [Chloroflexota bacterium]
YDVDAGKAAFVADVSRRIPFDASLSVEFFLGSHFAARPNVYWFPVNWHDSEYVLVDSGAWAWWSADDEQSLSNVHRSSMVELVARHNDVFLFQRKPEPRIQYALKQSFVNGVELIGYSVEPEPISLGAVLTLTLFWRASRPLALDLTVFNHVLDAGGKVVGQRDSQPDNGAYPTTEWATGVTIVDQHRIKLAGDAAVSSYSIEVGLYDLKSGAGADERGGG